MFAVKNIQHTDEEALQTWWPEFYPTPPWVPEVLFSVFNKALTEVTQKFSRISIQYRFQTEKISQIAMLLSSTDFVVNQNIITRNLSTTDLQPPSLQFELQRDKGYTEVCRYFLNLSAGWQELTERQNLLCKLLFCTSRFRLLHDHL
jgi:hypothetical protein